MPEELGFHGGVDGEEISQQQRITCPGSATVQYLGDDTAPLRLRVQRLGAFPQRFQKACRTQLASGLINSLEHIDPQFGSARRRQPVLDAPIEPVIDDRTRQ